MTHRPSAFLLAAVLSFGADVRPARGAELRGVFTDYSLTTWGPAEGLSSSAIWAIAQTEEGYLWLGTDAGPIRFDGVRFVPWETLGLPPLPSVAVRALSSSRDGSVWFGFGAPGRRNPSRIEERYATTAPVRGWRKAPSRCSSSIPTARSGPETNAACTAWSPIAGNGSKMACPQPRCIPRYVDRSGSFLVGTAMGTFRRNPGQNSFERAGTFSEAVQGISEDGFGTLWVSDQIVGFRRLQERGTPAHSTEKARGSRLLHDRRGNLWVGTFGRGLWRVRLGPKRQTPTIEKTTALTGFTVTSLFEDREGNLWAGTARRTEPAHTVQGDADHRPRACPRSRVVRLTEVSGSEPSMRCFDFMTATSASATARRFCPRLCRPCTPTSTAHCGWPRSGICSGSTKGASRRCRFPEGARRGRFALFHPIPRADCGFTISNRVCRS